MSGNDLYQPQNGQLLARIGDNGEMFLPVPGGFASLGLRPGSTVYVSLSPSFSGTGVYGAMGQTPIIIVNQDTKPTEPKKPEKKSSEVYKRL
jgi:hypothetical protein